MMYFFRQKILLFFHTGLCLLVFGSNVQGFDQYEEARAKMVKALRLHLE